MGRFLRLPTGQANGSILRILLLSECLREALCLRPHLFSRLINSDLYLSCSVTFPNLSDWVAFLVPGRGPIPSIIPPVCFLAYSGSAQFRLRRAGGK